MDKYPNKPYREQIDEIVKFIALTDFPFAFEELYQYFLTNFQSLNNLLNNQDQLLNDSTFVFLKTAKIILAERSPKALGDPKATFYNVYFKYLEVIHPVWDYL